MNTQYKICRLCGASLDPAEQCDCIKKREERIEDRPKPDTPPASNHTLIKHVTVNHSNMETIKMTKLKGLSEEKSAIIRYKIFRMNCKDDATAGHTDYKDVNRFYDEFIKAFKGTPEALEKEWLFFKGFIAGIEDEERLTNGIK